LRLFPRDNDTGGFFIAVLQKVSPLREELVPKKSANTVMAQMLETSSAHAGIYYVFTRYLLGIYYEFTSIYHVLKGHPVCDASHPTRRRIRAELPARKGSLAVAERCCGRLLMPSSLHINPNIRGM